MSLILVLSLQAAAVATPAPLAPPPAEARPRWAMPGLIARDGGVAPLSFDLERMRQAGRGTCLAAGAGDVLVCGARRGGNGDYPVEVWDRIFAPRPIRAEMNLGGNVQGRIHSEAVPMDRGAVSNRVMVGLRWPF
jgi:hypothetical protein